MSRYKQLIYSMFGVMLGLTLGTFMRNFRTIELVNLCTPNSLASIHVKSPLELIELHHNETPTNSQRNLVFFGLMTSKEFIETRAKAIYNTWGKSVPGRLAFFSSEGSVCDELPLIDLPGVDDSYPPQKKSFKMLYYMYEHFIDKFEWFVRADDDVFIKTDKLEKFLRSIDSSKPQFIGQAGKGNNEEFGLLSLEFDENFCMGGPGIIMSRETLRKVAPHLATCLKNLYSTHEDVEVGRCVQKHVGIPCTWNYEMQSILHHNSSGFRAFSGNLKNKEVHSAITLHPIKRAPLMYRLYAYNLGLVAQDLRQQSLYLHRDIAQMIELLRIPKNNKQLTRGVLLFPENDNDSIFFSDDHEILGNNPNLNRHYPDNKSEILEWDFISRSIYSGTHSNPKRKMESSFREGIEDVIREIMEHINNFSRQRGRVIEYRELLYGYSRLNTIYGHDLILDLLLVYKKYRGKKMTVPVRRHLYIQRSFTEIRIREVSNDRKLNEIDDPNSNSTFNRLSDKMKSLFNIEHLNEHINKLYTLSGVKSPWMSGNNQLDNPTAKIVFVLPLSGRYEIFLRFLNNFEEVVLQQNENVDLVIALFLNDSDSRINSIFKLTEYLCQKYQSSRQARINVIKLNGNFSRGVAINTAVYSNYIKNNDIIFFIDVDIYFKKISLERIRQNTIQNQQIYLPIVFSEYDPELVRGINVSINLVSSPAFQSQSTSVVYDYLLDYNNVYSNYKSYEKLIVDNDVGYFREFGYGLVSIYKSDILNNKVQGFVTDVKGWGLEDVKFLEKIIESSHQQQNQLLLNIADGKTDMDINSDSNVNLNIFRSADPSLVHIFHPIICDKNLEDAQYKMCLGTQSSTLGNYKLLKYKYFYKNDFIQFLKKAKSPIDKK